MRTYAVSARGLASIEVAAANWITALGLGLDRIGRAGDIERLACEVLPNGTVIARDIRTGTGYVVQLLAEGAADPESEPEPLPALGEALEERLRAIGGSSSSSEAAEAALKVAQELVPAESGAVILEEKGHLRFVAATGPFARNLVGVRLPPGTGVAGFSMQKRRTVVLGDASEDPRHCAEVDALTGYHTQDIACVPVVHQDRAFGVLELINLPAGERFTRQRIHHLEAVGAALGAVLAGLRS